MGIIFKHAIKANLTVKRPPYSLVPRVPTQLSVTCNNYDQVFPSQEQE